MQNEKVNILVLEDDGIVALGLEDTLLTEGYHVSGIADNGREALDMLKKHPVDLALLDIHVKGDWDGVDTAKKITEFREIPFIYLTAFSDEETIRRARDTSPSAYLVKPYQPQNLAIAIDLALHNFEMRKSFPEKKFVITPGDHSSLSDQKDDLLVFNQTVFVKQNYKFLKLDPENILYLEADGNHTLIITASKKYVVRHSIQSLLDKLNLSYIARTHRSFAVNLKQLSSFDANSVFVSHYEIPFGRLYKEDFFNSLNRL